MTQSLLIDSRYCGPPHSANGGYTCGRLAALLPPGPAEITLRLPPPLDRELQARTHADGTLSLLDGERLVATGRHAELQMDIPTPPALPEVEAAVARYAGFTYHAFPTCFVCGPEREPGDGLRIFAGTVAGRQLVAAPWTPDPALADEQGHIRLEYIWAALDCPGAFAVGDRKNPVVLGRLTAHIHTSLFADQPYRVIGWAIEQAERKATAGTAIFAPDGTCCAIAKAIWIELKPA